MNPLASAPQHLGRDIDAGDANLGIAMFEQVFNDLTRAAADIEHVPNAAQIELLRVKTGAHQRSVQRNETAGDEKRPFGPL